MGLTRNRIFLIQKPQHTQEQRKQQQKAQQQKTHNTKPHPPKGKQPTNQPQQQHPKQISSAVSLSIKIRERWTWKDIVCGSGEITEAEPDGVCLRILKDLSDETAELLLAG